MTDTNTGVVSFEATFKRNLGNYENLDIKVGVSDSPRGEETFSTAYKRVKSFVETRLIEAINEVEADIKSLNLPVNK